MSVFKRVGQVALACCKIKYLSGSLSFDSFACFSTRELPFLTWKECRNNGTDSSLVQAELIYWLLSVEGSLSVFNYTDGFPQV